MLLSKVFKLLWIIFTHHQFENMAANSADSDGDNSEFLGFNPEEIRNENDFYVPDSDPDSDITVSSVNTDEFSNCGDEHGESGNGEPGDQQAEWTQNFGGINVDEFQSESGPKLPDDFDVATATPIKYFDLLFPHRIFEILK